MISADACFMRSAISGEFWLVSIRLSVIGLVFVINSFIKIVLFIIHPKCGRAEIFALRFLSVHQTARIALYADRSL